MKYTAHHDSHGPFETGLSLPTSHHHAAAAAPASPTSASAAAAADADEYIRVKDHPARACADLVLLHKDRSVAKLLKPLKVLRSLQVAFTGVFLILCIVLLANRTPIRAAVEDKAQSDIQKYGSTSSRSPGQVAASLTATIISLQAGFFVLALSSLALDITWLLFTLHPGKRTRSCCGVNRHRPACTNLTCDMGWDLVCAAIWVVITILSIVTVGNLYNSRFLGVVVCQSVLGALVAMTHIATAVLDGLVRKRLMAAAATAAAAGYEGHAEGIHPNGAAAEIVYGIRYSPQGRITELELHEVL